MSSNSTDFFFEGKIVPQTIKESIYRMEDASKPVSIRSVFEDVMTGLMEEFLHKKNISLIKVEKFVNEKVKNLKTYVMHFENEKGESFKCAYLSERNSLKHGTTYILASSIIFTFAEYGCKFCNFKDKDCEFCDRNKIDKIFPPEMKLTIKHNMKEFIKVFGKDSVKSIKNFCDGYFQYMRSYDKESQPLEIEENKSEYTIPPEVKELLKVDPGLVDYVIKMITAVLGEYANNNKDIRNIMSEYTNVEKSFLSVINHLQRYNAFIKTLRENPDSIPDEIVDLFKSADEIDYEDDDEEDDEDGEGWKNGNQDDDE